MGEIVIPKHSADTAEMNAVLKIHYEADDWVTGRDFKKKLMELIGSDQYPSSYPKKAQVPAYFGFIDSKVSGSRISERRITPSGKAMYEAILNNNLADRQRLIMEALERIVFGRNNSGSLSSKSELEAPALFIRCVLDTGYCTSREYAHMIYSLNDLGKKYYETIPEIVNARSAGGIAIVSAATGYSDWKPILAMLRWGFLVKSEDGQQKLMLHPDVAERYADRLEKIRVYNTDKCNIALETLGEDLDVTDFDSTSLKPFRVHENQVKDIHLSAESEIHCPSGETEKQRIFPGDKILLVDPALEKLLSYCSFTISSIDKKTNECLIHVHRQFAINRSREGIIIEELKREDMRNNTAALNRYLKALFMYSNAKRNIAATRKKDIEPVNAVIRLTNSMGGLTKEEQAYALFELIQSDTNYEEVLDNLKENRKKQYIYKPKEIDYFISFPPIEETKRVGLLVPSSSTTGKQLYAINESVKAKYPGRISHLMVYAVDIANEIRNNTENVAVLPQIIKPVLLKNTPASEKDIEIISIDGAQIDKKKLVQGDYIVLVNTDVTQLYSLFVYQIMQIRKQGVDYSIVLAKRYVISTDREQEVLEMIKEK